MVLKGFKPTNHVQIRCKFFIFLPSVWSKTGLDSWRCQGQMNRKQRCVLPWELERRYKRERRELKVIARKWISTKLKKVYDLKVINSLRPRTLRVTVNSVRSLTALLTSGWAISVLVHGIIVNLNAFFAQSPQSERKLERPCPLMHPSPNRLVSTGNASD
jgi:hypothetical protein